MRPWAVLALLLLSARGARADGGIQTAPSIGPRLAFYKPNDADRGDWAWGGQLRLPMDPVYSFEASADWASYRSNGAPVRTTAVQATFLGYFSPDSAFSPYLLVGGGWYPTHADGPYNPFRLFGPHVGAGLQLLLGPRWSIDGSYRFLWTETVDWTHPLHLFGTDFGVRGHMLTIGLNRRL